MPGAKARGEAPRGTVAGMDARTVGESVVAATTRHGGVARVSTLLAEGFSRHHLDRTRADGRLLRVRRDWVAVPGADPELIAAARAGVVLSCVTLARRLGLWVLHEQHPHVAADPGGAGGKPAGVHVHWARPLVPRVPDALEDRTENALALVAACRPFEQAVAVWDSAVRQGRASLTEMRRLTLSSSAVAVLDAVDPFADSGLESLFRVRLRWLRVRILSQVWVEGRRVDFLIGRRLIVQLDGGHHVGAQRADDIAHDARLMLLGYRVLRFTYAQVVDDWPAVQDAIARAVGQRLHEVP